MIVLSVILVAAIFQLRSVCTRAADSDQTEQGKCTLQLRPLGRAKSAEQSASQYLSSLSERPSVLKALPGNVGKDIRYFTAMLGQDDVPIILDAQPNTKQPYVFYIDTDRDGKLSDEKAYDAKSIKKDWFGAGDKYRFGPISIKSPHTGKKIIFHVTTRDGERLSIYPSSYQKGKIRLADDTYILSVIDGNLDGRFDVINQLKSKSLRPAGHDSIGIYCLNSRRHNAAFSGLIPITKTIRVYDDYYDIALQPDGSALALNKTQLQFGSLDLGGIDVKLNLWSDIACQNLYGQKPWKLPEGRYSATALEVRQTDADKNTWSLSCTRSTGKLRSFKIQPNKTLSLKAGPPFAIKSSASRKDDNILISFRLHGQAGEQYSPAIYKAGKRMPAPAFKIVDKTGKVLVSDKFKYG